MKDDENLDVEGPVPKEDLNKSILREQNIEDDELFFKLILRKKHPYNPNYCFSVSAYVPCIEIIEVPKFEVRFQGLLNQQMADKIQIAETKEHWTRIQKLIDRLEERNRR